jgi:Flp pilus assembly pilin Flp
MRKRPPMFDFFLRAARDERGQSIVEYGLVIALIGMLAIAGLIALGSKVNNTFLQPSAQVIP